MKNKYKVILILFLAAFILWLFYRMSVALHCEEPTFCISPVTIDGILNEPCWDLKKTEFYKTYDKNLRTNNFSKVQFLRDSNILYVGVQFSFGSTFTGTLGDVFSIERSKNANITLQVELMSKKLSVQRMGDVEIECTLKKENDSIVSYFDCEKRNNFNCNDYKIAEHYTNDVWTIELSIPIRNLLDKQDRYISYKFEMYGSYSRLNRNSFSLVYPNELSFILTKYILIKNVPR